MKNRFGLLKFIDRELEELRSKAKNVITEEAKRTILKVKKRKKPQWMSIKTLEIAQDRQEAKVRGDRQQIKVLHTGFQRETRMDKEDSYIK